MFLVHFLLFVFNCQYQCKWLPGKTRLWNDLLCVKWDPKLYSHSFRAATVAAVVAVLDVVIECYLQKFVARNIHVYKTVTIKLCLQVWYKFDVIIRSNSPTVWYDMVRWDNLTCSVLLTENCQFSLTHGTRLKINEYWTKKESYDFPAYYLFAHGSGLKINEYKN